MSDKKIWTRSETLQLIEMFEQNRGLWDTTLGRNSGYMKKIKKRALLALAAEFDTSDLEVGRKLHNLKTQFSQELKKELQHTSFGEVYKSKWQYFEMMKFLQPTINSGSNSTDDSVNSRLEEEIEEELAMTMPSVKRNKKSTSQKKHKGDNDHPKPKPPEPDKDDDEYRIFGDYVANEIKNMHFLRYKGVLKRKIQRLIIEFTEMDDNEYLKQKDGISTHENGTSDSIFNSKPGPSQIKDESEIPESMYLVINGVKHFLDNTPQRLDDPLGKI